MGVRGRGAGSKGKGAGTKRKGGLGVRGETGSKGRGRDWEHGEEGRGVRGRGTGIKTLPATCVRFLSISLNHLV